MKVTHGACGAQRQVVHLLGERSHDSGGVDGQTGLDGRSGGDHSTLRPAKRHRRWTRLNVVKHHMKKEQIIIGINRVRTLNLKSDLHSSYKVISFHNF